MKEFFAVDTHLGYSESSSVIAREVDENNLKEQEDYTKKMQEYENRAKLPPALNAVRVVCNVLALILLCGFLFGLTLSENGKGIESILYCLFGASIFLMVIAFLLSRYRKRRAKKVAKDEGYLALIKEGERIYDKCVASLKIPSSAKPIDVFLYVYSTQSGEERPVSKTVKYVNTPVKVFSEANCVMVADLQVVFALKKEWFKDFEIIPEKVTFNCWNKDEGYGANEYRKYAIKPTATGALSVKNCYKFILEKDGESFAIVIPPYDGEAFLKLTGIKYKKGK